MSPASSQVAAVAEPFQNLAGHIALDFVNTLDNRYHPGGPLELLASFSRLVAFCRQTGVLDAAVAKQLLRHTSAAAASETLASARELREALHTLFRSTLDRTAPPPSALHVLNQVLRASRPQRVLTWSGSQLTWETETAKLDPLPILSPIARAAADLLTSPLSAHISECGAPTCRWLFLDRSRNHSRRWCDMKTCGNRDKARRFHARQSPRAPHD